MSIVALKRKSRHYKARISGQGTKGFSLNGGHRNQGWVGQGVRGRSLTGTPYRGVAPMGNGGHLGNYVKKINNRSGSQCCTNDPNIIKRSTMNNMGHIDSSFIYPTPVFNNSCEHGECPVTNWVKDFSPLNHSEGCVVEKRAKESGKCVILKSDAGLDKCVGPCGAASYHIGGKKYVREMYAKNLNMHDVGGQVYQRTALMAKTDLPTPPCKKPFPMALNHNGGCNGCQKNFMTPEEAIEGGMLPEDWMNCNLCDRNGMAYTTHLDTQNINTQTGRRGYTETELKKLDGQLKWYSSTNTTESIYDCDKIFSVSSDEELLNTLEEYFKEISQNNSDLLIDGYNDTDISISYSETTNLDTNNVNCVVTLNFVGLNYEEMDTYMREELKNGFFPLYYREVDILSNKIRITFIPHDTGFDVKIEFMNENADDIEHMPFNTHIVNEEGDSLIIEIWGKITGEYIDLLHETIGNSQKNNVIIRGAENGPLDGTQELQNFYFKNSDHPHVDKLVIENITIMNHDDNTNTNILEIDNVLILKTVYIYSENQNTVNAVRLNSTANYYNENNIIHFDSVYFIGVYSTAISAEGVEGDLTLNDITVDNLSGDALQFTNLPNQVFISDSIIRLLIDNSPVNIRVSNTPETTSFSFALDNVIFINENPLIFKETEYGNACFNNYTWLDSTFTTITTLNPLAQGSSPVGGLEYTTSAVTGITDVEYTTGSFSFTGFINSWQHLDFTQNMEDGHLIVSITVKLGGVQGSANMYAEIYEEDTLEPFMNNGSHITSQNIDSEITVHTGATANVTFTWSQPISYDPTKFYYFKIKEGNTSESPTIAIDSSAPGTGGSGNISATLYHSTGITIPETTGVHPCD